MKQEANELVVEALSGLMPMLPLRGADSLAREGGDLDFMVPAEQAIAACHAVARIACERGWYLAGFRNIGYLAQILLVQPKADGMDEAIKIDFFDGLRWYGVGRDLAGDRLFKIALNADHPDPRLAGAASFFQKAMIMGRLAERDWARVTSTGADTAYLSGMAKEIGLPITRTQIESRGVAGLDKWRLRAASGGAVGIISRMTWFNAALGAHIKFKLGLGTHAGIVIGISGMDGSGKSTLVDRLLSAYLKAGGQQPMLIHLLPAWIPLPHQLLGRRKTVSNYNRPYAEAPVSSQLNGGIRLAYYLCAFALARFSLWIAAKRGRQIVLDRSFVDFASDPTRSRIPAQSLPDWLVRFLMPCGLFFYLDVSPDMAIDRKDELSPEKARTLSANYRRTCDTAGITRLNANATADSVFIEILGHLSRQFLSRIEAA